MQTNKPYTIQDVINAECNLEPLQCVHCGHVGEVVYLQYVGDGLCQWCGEWQLEENENDND